MSVLARKLSSRWPAEPLSMQTFRTLGLSASIERNVVVKERARGFNESEVVESLVLLHAAGGDCVDDLRRLKADEGLEVMLGHAIPSPEMVRGFLERFHSNDAIETAKAQRKPEQIAFIPKETAPLDGLARVNDDLVREVGRRVPEQRIATVDADATIQESRKREALPHYEGGRGYQPQVAVWAELLLVLADEFRDGNVPAAYQGNDISKPV